MAYRIPNILGFMCPVCELFFNTRNKVRVHMRHNHRPSEYHSVDYRNLPRVCPTCFSSFASTHDRDLHQHRERHYGNFNIPCYYCHRRFVTEEELQAHMNEAHFRNYTIQFSAWNGRLQGVGRTFPYDEVLSIEQLRNSETVILHSIAQAYIFRWNCVLNMLTVYARFAKYSLSGEFERFVTLAMTSSAKKFYRFMPQTIPVTIKRHFDQLEQNVEAAQTDGSGLVLCDITGINLRVARKTFAGACENNLVKTAMKNLSPRKRRALIDVKSHWANGCLWSSIAQAYLQPEDLPVQYLEEGHRRYEETKLFSNQFLSRGRFADRRIYVEELEEVEKINSGTDKLNFALNVYVMEKRSEAEESAGCATNRSEYILYPAYTSSRLKKAKKVINLLLCGDVRQPEKMHYVFISNLTQLVLSPTSSARSECCPYCLNAISKKSFTRHTKDCLRRDGQRIIMPELDEDGNPPRLRFDAAKRRFMSPVIGYLDFECGNSYRKGGELEEENVQDDPSENEQFLPEKVQVLEGEELLNFMATGNTFTKITAMQEPITYGLAFVGEKGQKLLGGTCYSGETDDILKHLMDTLEVCYDYYSKFFNDMADIRPVLTTSESESFLRADKCWICLKKFDYDKPGLDKVLDHSHSSLLDGGSYLGAAHRSCNSARQYCKNIPIFVHNLDKYDGAFILRAMVNHAEEKGWNINAIPQNSERFLSLSVGPYKFLDSLHFMKGSLSQIVDSALNGGHNFPLLDQFNFNSLKGSQHKEYCLRKGVYPYRVAVTADQLRQTLQLPPQQDFYSDLTEQEVADEDYQFAHHFWQVSGCKNLLDYTEAYCMLDVMLLASCVELYRSRVYSEFQLDISQFLSGPHLAYHAMLLLLDKRVDLLTDLDMFEMFEGGIRGGVSHAALRHVSVPPSGVESDETLVMLDAVNLYGWSLRQPLPAHSFEWVNESELDSIDWYNIGNITEEDMNGESIGYVLEVDLEYPQELHENHCSFPLAPEHFDITEDMLSDYAKHCRELFSKQAESSEDTQFSKRFLKERKLAATFRDRKKYTIHYRCLSLYLKLGMKLKKVHRAIKFVQSCWIKDYVEHMTQKRRMATSKFEQQMFKDFVNHIFGKCIQDLRKQNICFFCMREEQWERMLRTKIFANMKVVNEECVIFFSKRKEIEMNRPYFAGFAVLELAKYQMYHLFYNEIKKIHPQAYCVFTDTDSLMIYAPRVEKVSFLHSLKHCMDFSNYPTDHPFYSTENKMIPGFLKDETCSKQVVELVALKSKVYSFKTEDENLNSKCKGAKKSIIKRDMRLSMYKSCLTSINKLRLESSRLQSKDYKMYLLRTRKVALSSYESKRYIFPCGIHSNPYYSKYILSGNKSCPVCGVSVREMKESLRLYEQE